MTEQHPTKRTIIRGITTSRPAGRTSEPKNSDVWIAIKQINTRLDKLEKAMKSMKQG